MPFDPLTKLSVLLVEDQEDHSALISRQLQRVGGSLVTLSHARSLSEALGMLAENRFDAVLLDLTLPDSTMSETLLSVMEEDPDTAVIVLTSLDDPEFASRAVSDGAQDFLPKSKLDGELLLRSIRYSVRRKASTLELERRNQELLRFAETIAHEVRTPMHVVSCCLQVIEKRCAPLIDERLQGLITDSRESMQNVARLTRRLLEFATVGASERDFALVELNAVFDGALAILEGEGLLDSADIAREDLPIIEGDEILLRQVFVNLVANAVAYRRDDKTPIIKLTCTPDGGAPAWELVLHDNGRGIVPSEAKRVFEIFQRGEGLNDSDGQGIGLAFCKKVIEYHGGTIEVKPAEISGSCVVIRLPRINVQREQR